MVFPKQLTLFILLFLPVVTFSQPLTMTGSVDYNLLFLQRSDKLDADVRWINTTLKAEFPLFEKPVNLQLSQASTLWRYQPSSNAVSTVIESNTTAIDLAADFQFGNGWLTPTLSGYQHRGDTRFGYGLKYTVRLFKLIAPFIGYHQRYQQYQHRWSYLDSGPGFNSWFRHLEWSGGFDLTWQGISGHVDYQQVSLTAEPDSGPFTDETAQRYKAYQTNWTLSLDPFDLVLTSNGKQGVGNPDLLFAGLSFSNYTETQWDAFSHQVGVRLGRAIIVMPYLIRSGQSLQSKGYLQAFPFTDGVIAIIGDFYFTEIDTRLIESGFGLDVGPIKIGRVSIQSDLRISHIKTDFTFQTWRPIFFLSGRQGEQTLESPYESAWVVPVDLSITFPLFESDLALNLSQIIPVSVTYPKSEKSNGSGSGGSSGSGGGGADGFAWGGFRATLSYVITIN